MYLDVIIYGAKKGQKSGKKRGMFFVDLKWNYPSG